MTDNEFENAVAFEIHKEIIRVLRSTARSLAAVVAEEMTRGRGRKLFGAEMTRGELSGFASGVKFSTDALDRLAAAYINQAVDLQCDGDGVGLERWSVKRRKD